MEVQTRVQTAIAMQEVAEPYPASCNPPLRKAGFAGSGNHSSLPIPPLLSERLK